MNDNDINDDNEEEYEPYEWCCDGCGLPFTEENPEEWVKCGDGCCDWFYHKHPCPKKDGE